jgi:uncharacterized coiled-coil DUF342 family protein
VAIQGLERRTTQLRAELAAERRLRDELRAQLATEQRHRGALESKVHRLEELINELAAKQEAGKRQ